MQQQMQQQLSSSPMSPFDPSRIPRPFSPNPYFAMDPRQQPQLTQQHPQQQQHPSTNQWQKDGESRGRDAGSHERPKSDSFIVNWDDIPTEEPDIVPLHHQQQQQQPQRHHPPQQSSQSAAAAAAPPAPVSFVVGVEDLKGNKKPPLKQKQPQQQLQQLPQRSRRPVAEDAVEEAAAAAAPSYRPAEKFVIDFSDDRPATAKGGIRVTPFQNKFQSSSLSYQLEFPKKQQQQQQETEGAGTFERRRSKPFQSKMLTPKNYRKEAPRQKDNESKHKDNDSEDGN